MALTAVSADAHQSGCHRWHSCPSDSGSYVCGDLGYTSGCGGTTPPSPPAATPSPSGPLAGANLVIGQGSGVDFSVDSPGGIPSVRIASTDAKDSYGVL